MPKDLYWYKQDLKSWMMYIWNNINDKAIEVEVGVKIKIVNWDMQCFESLLYLIRKLELNK